MFGASIAIRRRRRRRDAVSLLVLVIYTVQSAKKEEHIYRDDDDDDDVFSNRIGNRIVARRLPKKSNAFSPSFVDLASKKKATAAFFSPDEFSQKDLFVRVERLLVFGEREKVASARQSKEGDKKTLVVVVVKIRSRKKKRRREQRDFFAKTHVDDQR